VTGRRRRGPGVETARWLCEFSPAGVKPDRVLALTLDPALARARRIDRDGGAAAGPPSDLGKRIQGAYARLEEMDVDGPIIRIDASSPPDVVVEAAVAALRDLFPDEVGRRIVPTL
jgi:thymidylate kinase